MKKDYLSYVIDNRISGFKHPTREKIIEVFSKTQNRTDEVEDIVDAFFSSLNGELGHLNESALLNLQYTLVNSCFYFCEFLLNNNVDNELVYNASDFFINQASSVTTETQAKHFLTELALVNYDLFAKKRLVSYSHIIERSIKFIEHGLYSAIKLKDVAEYVGLTPQYLTTLFKKETGNTLYQFIKDKKMEEAKMLLSFSNESVTTIADALGFSSSAHFSNTFKKYTDFSPIEYRQTGSNQKPPHYSSDKLFINPTKPLC